MDGLIYAVVFLAIIAGTIYWLYETAKTAKKVMQTSGVGALWDIPSMKVLITISACILTIIFVQILTTKTSLLDRAPATPRDESTMAFVQCQKFVKDKLRSPSSAEFAFLDYTAKILPAQRFEIASYVEAQNAFGVKLKNRFICEVQWNGDDSANYGNWKLLNLAILDQ